jgi:FKBP-type peptidyl-prolyl cis-trans isomerase 2
MKNAFLLIFIAGILLSGCVDKVNKIDSTSVKNGSEISVDYIGSYFIESYENGKVFDTSIENVSIANNLTPRSTYEPLKFKVGAGQVFSTIEEGVLGMIKGETRLIIIPAEKGYKIDPSLIQISTSTLEIPISRTMSKTFEIPVPQFEQFFGSDHSVGDILSIPDTNINLTIKKINTSSVNLAYNLKVGSIIKTNSSAWSEIVTKVDNKNITANISNLTTDMVIQLPGAPFSTTIISMNNGTMVLKHNPINRVLFNDMFVAVNDTSLIIDRNPEIAGKTLIFDVTLLSINVTNTT